MVAATASTSEYMVEIVFELTITVNVEQFKYAPRLSLRRPLSDWAIDDQKDLPFLSPRAHTNSQ